jgi:hypothetical protein
VTNPPAIQPKLSPIRHKPLPKAMRRALARLELLEDRRAKSPGAYWRRYYQPQALASIGRRILALVCPPHEAGRAVGLEKER